MIHLQISSFVSYFEHKLTTLITTIRDLPRNLIVLSSNSPLIKDALLSRLKAHQIDAKLFDVTWLHTEYGSTGRFLRYTLSEERSYSVSLFDYTNIIERLSVHSLSEEININRDLFTKVSDSTIFILPQDLVDAIQQNASDFWSCVETYIDGTSWLQNPRELPIWYLDRVGYGLPLKDIFATEDKFHYFTNDYIKLRAAINSFHKFSYDDYNELNSRVLELKSFNYRQYIDLSLLLLQTLIDSTVDKSSAKDKEKLMSTYTTDFNIPQYKARAYHLVGEYWYRYGVFSQAKHFFQKAALLLEEVASNKNEICVLHYNAVVCKYLLGEITLSDFEESMHFIMEEPCSLRSNFDTFNLLVSLSSSWVPYSKRNIILQTLNEIFVKRPEVQRSVIYSEDLIAWENLLLGKKSRQYAASKVEKNRSDVLRLAYRLVYLFCIGETDKLRSTYKQFRSLALKYEERAILSVMQVVYSNMKIIISYTNTEDTSLM